MVLLDTRETAKLQEVARELEASRPDVARILDRIVALATGDSGGRYLTTGQAAAYLGVSTQTVRNWITRGWLRAERPHPWAHRRIPVDALGRVAAFRSTIHRANIQPQRDEDLSKVLSRHREDRKRRRSGEPIAGTREAASEAPEVAHSR